MKIKLNTIKEIKDFATEVTKFISDINIYHDNPNNFYDGKSLMALFAIDTSDYVNVEIKSKDKEEVEKFNEVMNKFRKE